MIINSSLFITSKYKELIQRLIISCFQQRPKDAIQSALCRNLSTDPVDIYEVKCSQRDLFGRYRQQPSPLLYSIDIWPARNSRLTQRETNHYIARCASVLAWSCFAGRSPIQLVIDLFAQHQRFAVCCPLKTTEKVR